MRIMTLMEDRIAPRLASEKEGGTPVNGPESKTKGLRSTSPEGVKAREDTCVCPGVLCKFLNLCHCCSCPPFSSCIWTWPAVTCDRLGIFSLSY